MSYMYYLMKNNYYNIANIKRQTINSKDPQGYATQYGNVSGWLVGKQSLHNLRAIKCFTENIDELFQLVPQELLEQDSFKLNTNTFQSFSSIIDDIIHQIRAIVNFCESSGFNEKQNGFDVKMPPTKDFNEFAEQVNGFQKLVLACPYLQDGDEKITLQKVDIGSVWICFAIACTAGMTATVILSNLSKLVDKAVKIKSHILTCKQQEEQLRATNQKNEVMEMVINGFKEYRKTLLDQCTNELEDEIGQLENGEQREQVKKSINALGELMSKGMEIYASIDAPDEIKDLFPTSDEIKSLNEPIKLLTEETKTE